MCLNLESPTGINSQTIIVAENNVECWESCEMKGAWVTHILTTDSQNSIHILLCFSQRIPTQFNVFGLTH